MKKNNRITLSAMALALLVSIISVGVVFAHEQRTVGKYAFVVGFLNEPAYSGLPNGLDLRISNKETTKPVEGLEKTLQAELIFGAKTMPITVRARFGQRGLKTGDLLGSGRFLDRPLCNGNFLTVDDKGFPKNDAGRRRDAFNGFHRL